MRKEKLLLSYGYSIVFILGVLTFHSLRAEQVEQAGPAQINLAQVKSSVQKNVHTGLTPPSQTSSRVPQDTWIVTKEEPVAEKSKPGLCKNYDEIYNLTRRHALSGVVSSQFILGKLYLESKCAKPDFEKAKRWLSQAANHGHVESLFYLGLSYYKEDSPYRDYSKSFGWFKIAKDKGDKNALYYIGESYFYGRGVRRDWPKARHWLNLAADRKDPRAIYLLGKMRQMLQRSRRGYKKAFMWYVKSALLGYNEAHLALGHCYLNGHGVPRDRVKAYTWYTIASLHGSKTGLQKKNQLLKSLSSSKRSEAEHLVKHYMKSIDYPEYQ